MRLDFCQFERVEFSNSIFRIEAIVKLIIAIVQPNRLEQIKEALSDVEVFRLP